jgi:hypothetical protein
MKMRTIFTTTQHCCDCMQYCNVSKAEKRKKKKRLKADIETKNNLKNDHRGVECTVEYSMIVYSTVVLYTFTINSIYSII